MRYSAMKLTAAIAGIALMSLPLGAQAKKAAKAAGCPMPDTTMQWFKDQRAWLDDSKHAWTNDTLRQQIIKAAGLDPSKPAPVEFGWTTLDAKSDPAAAAILKPMMARGAAFPTRGVVGAAGAHAAFLLLLSDSTLENGGMHHFMEAGLGEGFETETAMLEDRTRVRAGRGQIYGTVLHAGPDGKLVPVHLEDSAHVDLRRETAWLPPLKQSLCAAAAGQTSR
jgi:hypothetical protein